MPDFNGLGAFVAFLLGLADRVAAAEQIGRAAAVTTVRDEVVATLGEAAGGDTGPFPARPDLQAATQVARERRGLVADEPGLATGALLNSIRGSVEADGSAAVGVADAIVGSGAPGDPFRNIGDVAVAQEEGTGTVPQRSFLGIGGYRAAPAAAAAFVAPVIAALAGVPPPNQLPDGDAADGND